MITEEGKAHLEQLIDAAFDKNFNKALKYFGVDTDNHEEVERIRDDFKFIRGLRTSISTTLTGTKNALLISGVGGAVAYIFKHFLHSHT